MSSNCLQRSNEDKKSYHNVCKLDTNYSSNRIRCWSQRPPKSKKTCTLIITIFANPSICKFPWKTLWKIWNSSPDNNILIWKLRESMVDHHHHRWKGRNKTKTLPMYVRTMKPLCSKMRIVKLNANRWFTIIIDTTIYQSPPQLPFQLGYQRISDDLNCFIKIKIKCFHLSGIRRNGSRNRRKRKWRKKREDSSWWGRSLYIRYQTSTLWNPLRHQDTSTTPGQDYDKESPSITIWRP